MNGALIAFNLQIINLIKFTYINKWQLKINYHQPFPGLGTKHKMLLLFYNRYKAKLISFTTEVLFVQLNLIKHKPQQWKADCLNMPVALRVSGTVSKGNKSQYLHRTVLKDENPHPVPPSPWH